MKKPTNKLLDKIDMSPILDNIPESDTNRMYIDESSGKEHYRLLTWLGSKVKGRILELGTFRGHSALCFGLNGMEVHSFDIENHLSIIEKPDNVHFHISELGYLIGNDTKLIFLDTLHDGIYEAQVFEYLRKINWKGIIVMDDIILFPELANLWDEIPERKEDWSGIGHHSGTGIIFFE